MKDNTRSVVVFGSMRIPFLVLPPTCVGIGIATAIWTGHEINILYLVLALIGAVSAHISVNALNEYDDFKSGLDSKTEQTPFSGGSKTLPANPEKAHFALINGIVTLIITILIGIYFLYVRGVMILPLGVIGILIIVAYTKWITRNPLLCLIAPGIGFGHLMVMGTDFVLTGMYSWTAFVASFVPFFLVSDLLLLNQFPDIEADQSVGRKHMPITMGKKTCTWIYGILIVCAYLSIIIGYFCETLPLKALLALISIALAVPTVMGVSKNKDAIPKLIPFMGMNVVLILITHVLLIIGLIWAK